MASNELLNWNTRDNLVTTEPDRGATEMEKLEALADQLTEAGIDITASYSDWVKVGYALATAFGESGRELFHRLSAQYAGYSRDEADRKYTQCLKTNRGEVGLGSIYHLARQAGITLSRASATWPTAASSAADDEQVNLPTFSDLIDTATLPTLLRDVAAQSLSAEDADVLLLGALTCYSACLPNLKGLYDGREVGPNLFTFVTAQASAGKGRLTLCRHLVEPVHTLLRQSYRDQMADYNRQLTLYNSAKNGQEMEKPTEPKLTTLLLPANSSATAVYQMLDGNNGIGLMMETEGDTLAGMFKQDYGDYSDGFRKAFHHEPISYARRKDKEFVELKCPKLSVLLSGTPGQVQNLIPDTENGLFSRFIFYALLAKPEWHDVFAHRSYAIDEAFIAIGQRFFGLYKRLIVMDDIRFDLSAAQAHQFNTSFAQVQEEYCKIHGADIIASVRRLGLICYRIAMLLSVLRLADGDLSGALPQRLECTDADFDTACTMVKTLLQHTVYVYQKMPVNHQPPKEWSDCAQLYSLLPETFTRQDYQNIARRLGISPGTADTDMQRFCANGKVIHVESGGYRKTKRPRPARHDPYDN